jgi:hypothetical protein
MIRLGHPASTTQAAVDVVDVGGAGFPYPLRRPADQEIDGRADDGMVNDLVSEGVVLPFELGADDLYGVAAVAGHEGPSHIRFSMRFGGARLEGGVSLQKRESPARWPGSVDLECRVDGRQFVQR